MDVVSATEVVNAHRNNRYLTRSKDFYGIVKEIAELESGLEPEDRSSIVLTQNEDYDLTPEMDEARFLLGNHTEEYFEKFTNGRIKLYNFSTDLKNESVVNYLCFLNPQVGSGLVCGGWVLGGGGRSFGVRSASGEASAQK